ncbi:MULTISPECIES: terpene synthase family protein [Streptomyces]|uniref:Terpene synthase family protein n=1 Tax=Streptomyces flaveolus TaxID=67297 RepID=A0ABV1VK00_9ACTN
MSTVCWYNGVYGFHRDKASGEVCNLIAAMMAHEGKSSVRAVTFLVARINTDMTALDCMAQSAGRAPAASPSRPGPARVPEGPTGWAPPPPACPPTSSSGNPQAQPTPVPQELSSSEARVSRIPGPRSMWCAAAFSERRCPCALPGRDR